MPARDGASYRAASNRGAVTIFADGTWAVHDPDVEATTLDPDAILEEFTAVYGGSAVHVAVTEPAEVEE